MKIAAVVVLYRPNTNVTHCVTSYLKQVDRVYLIDNSESSYAHNIQYILEDNRVEYHKLGDNYGIAKALNKGASLAIEASYDLLLTMDQDSSAALGMVQKLYKFGTILGWSNIAIVAPMHRIGFEHEKPEGESYDVDTAWTSGCLMNLHNYRHIGGFDEKLFIDFVDHEYCLRAKKLGYRIIKVTSAELFHDIGDNSRIVHVFKLPLIITNHSPLRRYYITRNRFYVTNLYRNEFFDLYWRDKFRFVSELIIIFLFEDKKINKMKMIVRGLIDYFTENFGKYRNE